MRLRRGIALMLGVALVLGAAFGTGALSGTAAQRGVQGLVASDENAYLGLHHEPVTVTENNSTVELVRVTNDLDRTLTVSATVRDPTPNDPPEVTGNRTSFTLDSNDAGAITVDVICNQSVADDDVTVSIVAAGDGVTIVLSRTVPISCS